MFKTLKAIIIIPLVWINYILGMICLFIDADLMEEIMDYFGFLDDEE